MREEILKVEEDDVEDGDEYEVLLLFFIFDKFKNSSCIS